MFCTSWLALVEAQGRVQADPLAIQQYVLLGAVHGPGTPAQEVRSLQADHCVDLVHGRQHDIGLHQRLSAWRTGIDRAEALAQIGRWFAESATHLRNDYGSAVGSALSAGFDSRLVLASLLAQHVKPWLVVYGKQGSADVRIAQTICQAEGLSLTWTDKSQLAAQQPELDEAGLEASLRFFDAIPVDGIFDRGDDRLTRLQHNADGAIFLNGGGGEILRNFFRLRTSSYSAAQLIDAFYAGYDAEVFPDSGDHQAYRQSLEQSLKQAVFADGLLSRRQVEWAYALFRCRYWMGRNNAVSNRYGLFHTPLLDSELLGLSSVLPMAWKDQGLFEMALIAAQSQRLASYPSDYGHNFLGPIPLRSRVAELMHQGRPTWLRPGIARLGRRLSKAGDRVRARLAALQALLPGPLAIERWLRVAHLPDEGSVNRAMTIEYLLRTARLR